MVILLPPAGLTDLWLTQLRPAQVPYVWVVGETETNCADCLALDGEVRTLEQWLNTITPGSPNLSCSGYGCTCKLVPTIVPLTARAVQTLVTRGYFGRLFFGNKKIWHLDLNPTGRRKPRSVPPSHNFPEALPDLRPRKKRTKRWW
jgi:hypothetical protein